CSQSWYQESDQFQNWTLTGKLKSNVVSRNWHEVCASFTIGIKRMSLVIHLEKSVPCHQD
ncbi:MAG: hypothetical protein ACYTXY_16515, partial [Nostoc sp.]